MKTRWIGSVDGWMGFDGAQYTRALSSPVASELTQHKKHIQFRRCVCVARIAGWLPETGKNIPNKTLLILLVLYVRRKWTQHTHTHADQVGLVLVTISQSAPLPKQNCRCFRLYLCMRECRLRFFVIHLMCEQSGRAKQACDAYVCAVPILEQLIMVEHAQW